ncbi:hypothetical protein F0562_002932 [Nyssa sinensis]|uniref:Uncharacterized protein n=1 Tax=Nyssa sinensis TaxID=561372 RepID=A0A5J5BTR5_9ASTE|nr:hypothetical protein F0562_002932 [Nyssa sinensis]
MPKSMDFQVADIEHTLIFLLLRRLGVDIKESDMDKDRHFGFFHRGVQVSRDLYHGATIINEEGESSQEHSATDFEAEVESTIQQAISPIASNPNLPTVAPAPVALDAPTPAPQILYPLPQPVTFYALVVGANNASSAAVVAAMLPYPPTSVGSMPQAQLNDSHVAYFLLGKKPNGSLLELGSWRWRTFLTMVPLRNRLILLGTGDANILIQLSFIPLFHSSLYVQSLTADKGHLCNLESAF